MLIPRWTFPLTLSTAFGLVHGSVESEVGTNDWHRINVGAPVKAIASVQEPLFQFKHVSAPERPEHKQSALILVTEGGILASIDSSNDWRRSYELTTHGDLRYLTCSSDSIFVASRPDGSDLHSISATSGTINWQLPVSPKASLSTGATYELMCLQDPIGSAPSVVLYSEGVLSRIDSVTGARHWSWVDPSWTVDMRYRLSRAGSNLLALITWSVATGSSAQAQVHTFDLQSGTKTVGDESLAAPLRAERVPLLVASVFDDSVQEALIWNENGVICVCDLSNPSHKIQRVRDSVAFTQIHSIGLANRGVILAHRADSSVAVLRWRARQLETIWVLSDTSSSSLFSSFVDRDDEAHIGHLSFSSTLQLASVQILSLVPTESSPNGMMTGYTFPFSIEEYGVFENFALETAPVKDYSVASRIALFTASGSMQAWENSRLAWNRDEALAGIDSGVQPVVVRESAPADLEAVDPLERVINQLVSRFGEYSKKLKPLSAKRHKLAVVASSRFRTVHGIDLAGSGAVVWRCYARAQDFEKWQSLTVSSVDSNASFQVNAVAILKERKRRNYTLHIEDGVVKSSRESDIGESDDASVVHVKSTEVSKCQRIIKAFDDTVEGWLLCGEDTQPQLLWRKALLEGHKLQSVAGMESDIVASEGRVLGDRSTLLKQLDPNLVAVLAIDDSLSTIILTVIDSASGQVVHERTHENVLTSETVSLVFRDNWLVYVLRSKAEPASLSRVYSVELFQRDATTTDARHSSFRPDQIAARVFSKAYLSTEISKVLGISRTRLGITSYSVIFVNPLNQILALPRRMLDPRRVVKKLTREDQEELLLPYDALLPVDGRSMLSHRYQLSGVNAASTFPGDRESESVVLATGIDLFVARIAPSRSFDVLSPTFNKVQLVVTLSTLTIALGVTRSWVSSQQQRRKWYN